MERYGLGQAKQLCLSINSSQVAAKADKLCRCIRNAELQLWGDFPADSQNMLLAAKDAQREGNEKGTLCTGTLPGTMQSLEQSIIIFVCFSNFQVKNEAADTQEELKPVMFCLAKTSYSPFHAWVCTSVPQTTVVLEATWCGGLAACLRKPSQFAKQ